MSGAPANTEAAATERRRRWWLTALFLLAFAVRLYTAAFYPAEPESDAADYHRLAAGLSRGAGFVNEGGSATAWRPPGYPLFLSGAYALFGASPRVGYFAQAALGGLTVLLIVMLGRAVAAERAGLVAGLVAAVYPSFVWLPRVLLSENLAVPLSLAALVAAAKLEREQRAGWAAAVGLLLAAATLVRTATLIAAAILLAGLFVVAWRRDGGRGRRKALLLAVLAAAALPAALAPWAARNYGVFGRVVPVATQDGLGLYASYWPPLRENGKRLWGNLPGEEDPVVAEANRAGDEAAASDHFRKESVRRLRERPAYALRLIPEKLVSLVVPFDWEWFPHPARARSFNFGYVLLIVPALCGALALWRRRARGQWLLWVLPVAALAQAVVFYGSPRFRLPAETSAVVWAGVCLASLPGFYKRLRGPYDVGRGRARRASDERRVGPAARPAAEEF